jgi:hypothetical protein
MESSIARKLEPPILNPLEIESTLLNRLASIGQKNYAERIGVSESAISKRKADNHFTEMAREISALELQVTAGSGSCLTRLPEIGRDTG